MNRADLLRKRLPGAPDDLITALAARPAAEVGRWLPAIRQARRDAVDHQAGLRRQRRADARAHNHYDEEQLRAAVVRRIGTTGQRAADRLDALESLAQFIRNAEYHIALAVADLRSRGFTDRELAAALGVTPEAVGQR